LLSIVLPCYNPPKHWDSYLVSQYQILREQIGEDLELIVVNDGSRHGVEDRHISRLRQEIPHFSYVHYPVNKGKGYAIRQGMQQARGTVLIYTDIDFPYSTGSFMEVYRQLETGACDVAVGIKDDHYYKGVPMLRRIISRSLRFLIRIFLRIPITDTQCGLKGFNRKVLPLFLQTGIDRYLFDLEFIRNCFAAGKFNVEAIPVRLNEGVVFRKMNYRVLIPEFINFIRVSFKKPHEK